MFDATAAGRPLHLLTLVQIKVQRDTGGGGGGGLTPCKSSLSTAVPFRGECLELVREKYSCDCSTKGDEC